MKKAKVKASVCGDDGAVADVLSALSGIFSEGDISVFGDRSRSRVDTWVPTPVKALDDILGGGFPSGRLIEVAGGESSGKTTLVLHVLSAAQKLGYTCIFCDAENALDPQWVKNCGVDAARLVCLDPDTIEDFFKAYRLLCKKRKPGVRYVIVLDSVPALPAQADVKFYEKLDTKKAMGEAQPGNQARAYANFLKKAVKDAAKHQDVLIFINQLRDNLSAVAFGKSYRTPGGRAIRFHASIRLYCAKIATIRKQRKGVKHAVAVQTEIETVKNKLAPPHQKCVVQIEFGGRVYLPTKGGEEE